MKTVWAILSAALLAGCAGYSGSGLKVGEADHADVMRVMGPPALQWAEPDGSRLLAYPRGPTGVHTYMVLIGPDGRLRRIENVMDPKAFARVRAGMSKDQVLRTLGPPDPSRTVYFKARDELAWDWRYCDDWNQLARFIVLFDGATEAVRSTMSLREEQTGNCGRQMGSCWCAH